MIGIARPNRFFAPWEFVDSLLKVDEKIITATGALIEENRNTLARLAMNEPYLIMIDTDMVFTNDDVKALVARQDHDIVCGLFHRGDGTPALYNSMTERTKEDPRELTEVAGCGMAFTLISQNVLHHLGDRPFDRIKLNGVLLGEDLSFCYRATQAGFHIYCDPSIRIGHIRTQVV